MKKRAIGIAFLVICTAVMGVCGFARDATDSYFYNFAIVPRKTTILNQPYRAKDTSTSVYLYLTGAENNRFDSVYVRVYGTGDNDCTLTANGKSGKVTCNLYTEYEIYNNVYEKGYRFANIGFESKNYLESQKITGRWSPDCIGNFPVAS